MKSIVDLRLWIGILLPPLSFAAALTIGLSLAETACHIESLWPLHVTHLTGLALAAAGGVVAWTTREEDAPPDAIRSRVKLMRIGGIAMSAFFVLLLAGMEIPNLILGPCDLT